MSKYAKAKQLMTNGTKNGVPQIDQGYASLYVVVSLLADLSAAGLHPHKLGPGASINAEVRAAINAIDVHAARQLMRMDFNGPWTLSE